MAEFKLILGAAILLFGSTANAAIITSSYMNSLEEIDGWARQTMTLNMFDSSLGTLDYAILTHQIEGQASLILDNDSPASVTFDYNYVLVAETELFIAAPIIGVDLSQYGVTLDADDGDGAGGQNGGPDEKDFGTYSATLNPQSAGASPEILDYNTLGFPEFSNYDGFSLSKLGGGTFDTGCQLHADNYRTPTPAGVEATRVIWGACGTTIEYHFTKASVPEPSAILLFGIGMVGLIGFSKRRKVL